MASNLPDVASFDGLTTIGATTFEILPYQWAGLQVGSNLCIASDEGGGGNGGGTPPPSSGQLWPRGNPPD
jgi:hypothetical protein